MAKITLVKNLNGSFVPAHPSDYDEAKKIKVGEERVYDHKRPRNYEFHKKAMALFRMVFDNQEDYKNIDHLRDQLTIEAGYFDSYPNHNQEEVVRPKSISFASMDQDQFEKYYSDIIDVIVKVYGFDKEDILDNLQEFY